MARRLSWTATMKALNYKLVKDGSEGRLLVSVTFATGIVSTGGEIEEYGSRCRLYPDGRLEVAQGFLWDFGSWAIDTPAMVRASLAHDALCRLTNRRAVPWEVRAEADAYFRKLLKEFGNRSGWLSKLGNFVSRWWRWAGVRIYSSAIARWRDRET